MLCYPFEEKRLLKWKPPFIVQPKLDGVRCRALRGAFGNYQLLSSEEKEIISVPHVTNALNALEFKPAELDGELYCHGMSFEEIFSRTSRTANQHIDADNIKFHIFDLPSEDHQAQRLLKLVNFNGYLRNPLIMVSYKICNSLEDILSAFDQIIEEGYEGIVVRHMDNAYIRCRSTLMMKFKPKKDDYYVITGYKEEVSKDGFPKGRLGALVCSGGSGDTFSVGSGLSDDDRCNLWDRKHNLIGKLAHVKYQHITSGKGVPRFPVFIEIIEREPTEVGLRL